MVSNRELASIEAMTRSEVVRHRSRLLEEAEHRKLLEKWIFEGLSDEERDGSPPALLDRARTHFRKLADAALREARRRPGQDAPFPAVARGRPRTHLDPLPELHGKESSVPHVGSAQVVWASNLLPPAEGRLRPDSKEGESLPGRGRLPNLYVQYCTGG